MYTPDRNMDPPILYEACFICGDRMDFDYLNPVLIAGVEREVCHDCLGHLKWETEG